MAEWTNLPDQEPGNPALASWANAVRDNAIAMADGAPGAPMLRIWRVEFLTAGAHIFTAPKDGWYRVTVIGGGGRGGDALPPYDLTGGGGGGQGSKEEHVIYLTAGDHAVSVGAGEQGSSFAGIVATAGENAARLRPGSGGGRGVGVDDAPAGERNGGPGAPGHFGSVQAPNGAGSAGGFGGKGHGAGGGGSSAGAAAPGTGAPGAVVIEW